MMSMPLISIIICTYNRKQFIAETLESAFNQTYQPTEILIVDDGSSDDTKSVISSYGDRVRYFRQDNQGITVARNNGCKLACGEYITFQDDDDPMTPSKLTDLYNALCLFKNAVFAVGDLAVIDNNSEFTGERWLPDNANSSSEPYLVNDSYASVLWPKVPAGPTTTLFKKKDGEAIDWFDTRFAYGSEDKDFYARLALLGPIVYLPEVVTYYRRGHTSMTNKPALIFYSQILLFSKHLKNLPPTLPSVKNRLQERLLIALKELEKHRSISTESDLYWLQDSVALGVSMLSAKGKLEYYIHKSIKLPIRKIIR